MANILIPDDFGSGEYKVPQNCFDSIQDYLDKYEKQYLTKALGADLYDLFIADLVSGVPVTPIYLSLFDPFHIDEDGCVRFYDGMKEMLKQFCYYHIIRDLGVKKGIGGVGKYNSEVSDTGYKGFNISEAYNEGVDNVGALQWYICDNDASYPEYNGQYFKYMSGI
jgi:hypothetical protein